MNKLEAISTRLQTKEVETLKKYYELAISENKQHFFFQEITEELRLDYSSLKALSKLRFVYLEMERQSKGTVYTSYYLTLFPSAMERAEFENYNSSKQWLIKTFLNYREWIALAGFTISLVLVIVKIYEVYSQSNLAP